MNKKIVFIGGGSVIWTPTFANDLFQQSSLAGSQLVLVDIDQDALRVLTAYCTRLSHQYQTGWSVASADLDAALEGADFVCLSISTGGFEAMHHDYTIPERYGVFHTVGDMAGPGGISRTLRNVPVFVQVARKMEQLCPDAWLIHVTNP
ncbi:MAG: alpha-glucosidase/alpha-galactosidase, partial [Eubacteriales bacterium]|nr:alpha-glucosidase/alpha-galactosidase [Eubacteriales bacterium]